jgi:hypothetical protein
VNKDSTGDHPFGDEPPKAVITQVGRWRYWFTICHGTTELSGGWHVWGRVRAEKKARRVLAKYLRDEARRGERWTISGDDLP